MQFTAGTLVRVTKDNDKYAAVLTDGTVVTEHFENHQLRRAVEGTGVLKMIEAANGPQWRNAPLSEFESDMSTKSGAVTMNGDHETVKKFLAAAPGLRPASYKMNDVQWRTAVRAVLRGKNIMVTGPKGTGKTVLAFTLADVLKRQLFNIPLGSTQDPRGVLIGNTHFKQNADHSGGTFTSLSYFAQAIQIPNAIILLDELTRAHPDAWNILMPVLDYKQRYLRIDESPDTPTIAVAPGVTFIATANIGPQYTATRVLDSALVDRFNIVEVQPLTKDDELELLRAKYVPAVEDKLVEAIVNIAVATRQDAKSEDAQIPDGISTRSTIEVVELIYDGFTLPEALEAAVYPQYSEAGGASSPRAHVKKIAQRFIPNVNERETPFQTDDDSMPWETPNKP